MLRCCLGAHGCPDHAWMPSLGAGLIRLSQVAAPFASSFYRITLPLPLLLSTPTARC
jgi:hypothetical protein